MSQTPLICVITPTKNRIKLLCEAIDSVQRQSFDAWEHLIVDDGSDDGTNEEVTKRAAADSRIRYIRRTSENLAPVCAVTSELEIAEPSSSSFSTRTTCFGLIVWSGA